MQNECDGMTNARARNSFLHSEGQTYNSDRCFIIEDSYVACFQVKVLESSFERGDGSIVDDLWRPACSGISEER
jgi:hypothetical protein